MGYAGSGLAYAAEKRTSLLDACFMAIDLLVGQIAISHCLEHHGVSNDIVVIDITDS